MNNKYSIVLPIKINTKGNEFTLFKYAGIESYNQFLDTTNLDKFYIICPANDIPEIKSITESNSKIPYEYISEEEILGPNLDTIGGWYKQQLIKLVIANYVKTKYYLVIDGDMYLNQLLMIEDIFYKDKIKYTSEPWQTENSEHYSTNSNWWKGSCNVLKMDIALLENEQYLMGVTPQVLVSKYVIDLLNHLKEVYGLDWQRIICDLQFTEFTLYWLYLMSKNLVDEYTHKGYPLWKHDHHTNVLSYRPLQIMLDSVRYSFTESNSHFSVIQGYLNVSPVDIFIHDVNVSIQQKQFRNKMYDAVFLISSMLAPNRYQSFSIDERFKQTIETVTTARLKIPNSYCILIEGSILSDTHREEFKNHFNDILEYGDNSEVQGFVNNPYNIGHGELKLLEKGLDHIIHNRIRSRWLFKFGARYILNDNFDLSKWDPKKYNFRPHIDNSINDYVYTTGLYNAPVDRMIEFRDILINSQNILTSQEPMVERVYYKLIPRDLVNEVNTLGLEGKLSYNRHFFSV